MIFDPSLYSGMTTLEEINAHGADAVKEFNARGGRVNYRDGITFIGRQVDVVTATGKIMRYGKLIYEGDLLFGMCHGRGKCIYKDGTVYDGEWKWNTQIDQLHIKSHDDVPNGILILKRSSLGEVVFSIDLESNEILVPPK